MQSTKRHSTNIVLVVCVVFQKQIHSTFDIRQTFRAKTTDNWLLTSDNWQLATLSRFSTYRLFMIFNFLVKQLLSNVADALFTVGILHYRYLYIYILFFLYGFKRQIVFDNRQTTLPVFKIIPSADTHTHTRDLYIDQVRCGYGAGTEKNHLLHISRPSVTRAIQREANYLNSPETRDEYLALKQRLFTTFSPLFHQSDTT